MTGHRQAAPRASYALTCGIPDLRSTSRRDEMRPGTPPAVSGPLAQPSRDDPHRDPRTDPGRGVRRSRPHRTGGRDASTTHADRRAGCTLARGRRSFRARACGDRRIARHARRRPRVRQRSMPFACPARVSSRERRRTHHAHGQPAKFDSRHCPPSLTPSDTPDRLRRGRSSDTPWQVSLRETCCVPRDGPALRIVSGFVPRRTPRVGMLVACDGGSQPFS